MRLFKATHWILCPFVSIFSICLWAGGNIQEQLQWGKEAYLLNNYQLALAYFQAANYMTEGEGNAEALYYIGLINKVRNQRKTALQTLMKSGQLGYQDAYYQCGIIYSSSGQFVDAVKCYTLAAKNQHLGACTQLASVCTKIQNKKEGEKKFSEVQSVFMFAVGKNHPTALFNLGLMYAQGFFYEQNLHKAIELIELAKTHGLPDQAQADRKIQYIQSLQQNYQGITTIDDDSQLVPTQASFMQL
ncbi:hypothetical protein [Endozoicomonas sp. Mp262]|uniref:tetratricopeptide repeat protein n=1 Tax=Endozoicomonas sp. Mp262 TaxID=2919499 RepID=UPI0021D8FC93